MSTFVEYVNKYGDAEAALCAALELLETVQESLKLAKQTIDTQEELIKLLTAGS